MKVKLPGNAGWTAPLVGGESPPKHMTRVDGTALTPEDLDRVVAHAARAADGWNAPLDVQRPPRPPRQPKPPKPLPTHCKRGHPFDEANTRRRSDGRRECRTCRTAYFRDYHATGFRRLPGPNGRPLAAFCHRGHPMSGDNLHIDANGKRQCRECRRMNERQRNRQAA